MDVGAVVFLIFLLIAAAIMLLAFMLEESAQKKAEGLKNAVEIRDDEVVLPRRMRLTRGRFYLRAVSWLVVFVTFVVFHHRKV
ncbi:hypothetical protein [Thermococcus celer]|uniref:Uncharacterized protein n=1 Tax=Thermococcus celer Vu 13 = JCM 8558 TaxID=1293037 RepID=A0A218P3H0_THECE|nr:hypothetical protein [Thermococcus celer]ASI99473.1 hypothetical protein A3L02_07835 [Thermococcus celer Vu 13 = JCM 8558]